MTELEPTEQARILQRTGGLASIALLLLLALICSLLINFSSITAVGLDFVANVGVGAATMNLAVSLTMRGLLIVFVAAQSTSEADSGRAALGLLRLTHWALLALALTGILWYMPARPDGIALGIVLGLLAFAFASYRIRNHSTELPRAS